MSKKKKPEAEQADLIHDSETVKPSSTMSESKEVIPRLNLPLTSDGLRIDWERVRPSNRQKFAALMQTDSTAKEIAGFGVKEEMPEGGDPFGGISQANVSAALDIFSQANALLFRVAAANLVKHPFKKTSDGKPAGIVIDQDVLSSAFKLTAEQHTELDPRATKIAQRYGGKLPEWLQKNLDLYMLGGMFLKYTAENAMNALRLQVLRDVETEKAKQAKARAGRPISQPASSIPSEPSTMEGEGSKP